jgi:hypothetical protein
MSIKPKLYSDVSNRDWILCIVKEGRDQVTWVVDFDDDPTSVQYSSLMAESFVEKYEKELYELLENKACTKEEYILALEKQGYEPKIIK